MRRFAIFLFSILALSFDRPAHAENEAARILARSFYRQALLRIEAREWAGACRNLERAFWLDPTFEVASARRESLLEFLQETAKREYEEGARAFRALRFGEALLHWRLAKSHLITADDPLGLKIDKAIAILATGEMRKLPRPALPEEEGFRKIQALVGAGKKEAAILELKEVLRQNPADNRAKALLERLQMAEKGSAEGQHSEEIRAQFAKAEELGREGSKALDRKDIFGAYRRFREALALSGETGLRSPDYPEWEKKFHEVETRLKGELGRKLPVWEKSFHQGKPDLKRIGKEMKTALQKYPPSPEAKNLLSQIWDALEKRAEPLLMKAKTIQELEGCFSSKPYLTAVQEEAPFPEVPAWQEAGRNLEACLAGGRSQ